VADRVQESIVVEADVATVLETVASFDDYPEWQDEMKAAETLETDENGWGTKARFTVDAKVLSATFTLEYEYTETSMSWTLVEGDKLTKNDGSYELKDLGDGRTEVTYTLEVGLSVPLPGMVRRRAAKQIVGSGLKGLKQRVET
jgi:ribosome-associated toxin RatA of RatAB toxin-antitoxin module